MSHDHPNGFAPLYQQINFFGRAEPPDQSASSADTTSYGRVSQSMLVNTAAASSASAPIGSTSSIDGMNSIEGRVAKPRRRRPRASRRAPTTLLNTDTTNFRAMVQQFTGGPSAHYVAPGLSHGPLSITFGRGIGQQVRVSPIGIHHVHQSQQGLVFPQQDQEHMISMDNNSNRTSNEFPPVG